MNRLLGAVWRHIVLAGVWWYQRHRQFTATATAYTTDSASATATLEATA